MRPFFILFTLLAAALGLAAQSQRFEHTDIVHFWEAYNKIKGTQDSSLQYQYLKEWYLDKAGEGQKSLQQVKNYSAQDYMTAIQSYPKFWQSLKINSLQTQQLYPAIAKDIRLLKRLYPSLKHSTIYFTMGAFRSNGTILGNRVLISCELTLGDATTVLEELPNYRQDYFRTYQPKKNLPLLCTHEYVHTQQKEPVDNILSYCLYEGVAEYVSCLATGKKSNTPAIEFGKAHQAQVINLFLKDMYFGNLNNWLWGENRNELKVRDLGYYVGYEICERYYQLAANKKQAIKDLIELDFADEKAIERIVDATHLLPASLQQLWDDYQQQRPTVVLTAPFANNSTGVKPGLTEISFTFSGPLDKCCQGLDFGPLGESTFQRITIENRQFSADGKTWTIRLPLEPNKHYQYVLSSNFRDANGIRLKPFLLDFTTAAQ